jgi:hypothetical protein
MESSSIDFVIYVGIISCFSVRSVSMGSHLFVSINWINRREDIQYMQQKIQPSSVFVLFQLTEVNLSSSN